MDKHPAVDSFQQGYELLEDDIHCNICMKSLLPSKGMIYFVLQETGGEQDKFLAVH